MQQAPPRTRAPWSSRSCGPCDRPAAVAVGLGAGRDAAGVGAGVGLGDPERHVEVAGRGAGQERLLEPVVAELHHRVEPEHGEVQRRAAVHRRARCAAISCSMTAASVMPRPPPPYSSGIASRASRPRPCGRRSPTGTRARGRSAPSSRRRTPSTPSAHPPRSAADPRRALRNRHRSWVPSCRRMGQDRSFQMHPGQMHQGQMHD